MEQPNLDFEVELSREQWEELGRVAADLGPDDGYDWDGGEEISVFVRADDTPAGWEDLVASENVYGGEAAEVARVLYNGGRPMAEVEPEAEPEPPQVTPQEQEALRQSLHKWVRNRWHGLMREAGLHYERGHLPQS